MTPLSRILLAASSLLLVGMYYFPMWSISLDAPQYPEGLGLKIHINTVKGAEENDLQNINGLNHYIGMKRIEPDSIAELRYMPMIIGAMIALGLLFAALGRLWMPLLWSGLFSALGVVGLVDFYLWEYDYGHNLDPTAAIVIPGMAYQPPLIGSKQLLNFTAHSYPDIAGYIAGVSILLGFAAWFVSRRHWRQEQANARSATGKGKVAAAGFAVIAFGLSACEPSPEAVDWGKEECAHCKMNIADKRFAAQVLTEKGKAYKFDAIECMAAFVNEKKIPSAEIHSLWVADYATAAVAGDKAWLNAKKSFFLAGEHFQSPMSLNIAAFPTRQAMAEAKAEHGGDEMYWDGVRLFVAKQWRERGVDEEHRH